MLEFLQSNMNIIIGIIGFIFIYTFIMIVFTLISVLIEAIQRKKTTQETLFSILQGMFYQKIANVFHFNREKTDN